MLGWNRLVKRLSVSFLFLECCNRILSTNRKRLRTGMIFCLRKKTQFEIKYPSVNIQGNFERGGLMILILAWLNRNTRLVKCPLHAGRGREPSHQLWKGNPLNSNIKPSHCSFLFFFFPVHRNCDGLLPACTKRCLPGSRQTDRPTHSCHLPGHLSEGPRWHLGAQAWQSPGRKLRASHNNLQSPATLKLALHIRLRTRCFQKKRNWKTQIPLCFLSVIEDITTFLKQFCWGGGVGNRDRAGCGTQQRREMAF